MLLPSIATSAPETDGCEGQWVTRLALLTIMRRRPPSRAGCEGSLCPCRAAGRGRTRYARRASGAAPGGGPRGSLAKGGRASARLADLDGVSGQRELPQFRVVDLDAHLPGLDLGIGKDLANVPDAADGNASVLEERNPLAGGPRGEQGIEPRFELVIVRDAGGVGLVARVVESRILDRASEAFPQAVVSDADDDVAVRGRERLVRREGRMPVPESSRSLPRHQEAP